jgi:fibronectin type 3 domain-containing protein
MRASRRLAFAGMIASLGILAAVRPGVAQTPPELWLMARGDTVLVQLPEPPTPYHGFVVYRGEAGSTPELITPEPVRPVRDPVEASHILGGQRDDLMADLRVSSEVELLRRLRADRLTAAVMSMSYREVAEVLGRLYADTGLREGAEYVYRVAFVDPAGEETGEVRSGRVRVVDVEPGRPTGVSAEPGNREAAISWSYPRYSGSPTDFVSGFHIYRAQGAGSDFERVTRATVVRTGAEARWVDSEVRNDVAYRYRVRAVDMAGREGPFSEVVSVTPIDDTRPAMPSHLVTEAGEDGVRLAWRISPEPWVVGYRVERSLGLDQRYAAVVDGLVPAENPTHLDWDVRGGTQYFYRIIAVDERGGESRPSNPIAVVAIDRTPPEPAVTLTAVPEGRRVRVRWGASPSEDLQGYHIYRGDAADRMVRLTDEPFDGTEFLDDGSDGEGLNPGGNYLYRIIAVDHSYNESESVEARVEIPDDLPPDPATALQANNIHGRYVEVRWSPSPSLDVARYELARSTLGTAGPGVPVELGTFPADGRDEARDTTVTRGERYRYTLVAIDSAGNRGEEAVAELGFRDITAPPAPRRAEARITGAGVQVSWERVVARNLVGYRVYRATIPTGTYEPVSELIADPRIFTDHGGREGHYYTVRAVDSSGNESRPSPAVRAERP